MYVHFWWDHPTIRLHWIADLHLGHTKPSCSDKGRNAGKATKGARLCGFM